MVDVKDEGGQLVNSSRRTMLGFLGLAAAGSALPTAAVAQAPAMGGGAPASRLSGPLRSAGVMTFGPDDVLFVGDITGAAVHAFAFRPTDFQSQKGVELGNYHNFEGRDLVRGVDTKLAALLGTTVDQIVINDMVVHQPTQQILLSVERGRSTNAMPVLAKVDRGEVKLIDLSRVPHSKVTIANEPDPSAMMEFYPQRQFAITDVKYHDGEVFVTGVSNLKFQSTLHRIAYPFMGTAATSTVEIWHPVHGEWESRAPIIRHLIREIDGEPYLFAVFGCTPLVRFPLSSLKDGAHVRGDVIGELGYGSNPIDMMTFTNPMDKKDYLIVTIDVRSASRIAVADMATAPAEPTGTPIDFGPGGLGKTQGLLPINAQHFAILNPQYAVQVARHPKTGYRLDVSTLIVPFFFERHDGESEMNFPDGPDPFDYRPHKGEVTKA